MTSLVSGLYVFAILVFHESTPTPTLQAEQHSLGILGRVASPLSPRSTWTVKNFQAATSPTNHVVRLAMPLHAQKDRPTAETEVAQCICFSGPRPRASETDQSAHLHQGLNLTCSLGNGSAKYGPHGLDKVLPSFLQGSPGDICVDQGMVGGNKLVGDSAMQRAKTTIPSLLARSFQTGRRHPAEC